MSLDKANVAKIARLARLALDEDQLARVADELNKILEFVEQLNALDTTGVPPMTSTAAMRLRMRDDLVTDGGDAAAILANAPAASSGFFTVPKVVE